MDIDNLKTFLEISRTRHFGQAAKNLCITQSAVSVRIRQLEQQVGSTLFVRQRNNLQLTDAGEKLLRYAETILVTWNRARQELSLETLDTKSLVIGSMPSLWDITLTDWLCHLSKTQPKVYLQAVTHGPEVLLSRVQAGTIDLAFVFDAPPVEKCEVREIMQTPLIMISTHKGLSIDNVFDKNYVLVDWGTAFAEQHAKHFEDIPIPRIRLPLGRIALGYILEAQGSCYLAEPMVEDLLKKKKLFMVKGAPVINRAAYALYSSNSDKLDIIEAALNSYFTD